MKYSEMTNRTQATGIKPFAKNQTEVVLGAGLNRKSLFKPFYNGSLPANWLQTAPGFSRDPDNKNPPDIPGLLHLKRRYKRPGTT